MGYRYQDWSWTKANITTKKNHKAWPVEANRNIEISITECNIETNISSEIRWASIHDIKRCQCKCRYKRTKYQLVIQSTAIQYIVLTREVSWDKNKNW